MRISLLEGMLLIQNPSVQKLSSEILNIAQYFLLPCFLIALISEYFQGFDFGSVVKKLLLVFIFMSFFMQFHQEGVKISLSAASELLQRVSPQNIFVKKFSDLKLKSSNKNPISFNFIDEILIPDLNDLVATLFFVLGKVLLWFLKLIYSTVYHFTYIFSGITALLYFFTWTKSALKVTIILSIWCMVMPFIVVSILTIVGTTFDAKINNNELLISSIDTIVWMFGITALLLFSSFISFGILNGDGVSASGARVTEIMGGTLSKVFSSVSSGKNIGKSFLASTRDDQSKSGSGLHGSKTNNKNYASNKDNNSRGSREASNTNANTKAPKLQQIERKSIESINASSNKDRSNHGSLNQRLRDGANLRTQDQPSGTPKSQFIRVDPKTQSQSLLKPNKVSQGNIGNKARYDHFKQGVLNASGSKAIPQKTESFKSMEGSIERGRKSNKRPSR